MNVGETDRQTMTVIDRQRAELRCRQLTRRDRARQTEREGRKGFPVEEQSLPAPETGTWPSDSHKVGGRCLVQD